MSYIIVYDLYEDGVLKEIEEVDVIVEYLKEFCEKNNKPEKKKKRKW